MHSRCGWVVVGIASGVVSAGGVHAGDLDPPAGAVIPTMKDLDDVEARRIIRNNPDGVTPIVIDQPGSYYLGEDIQGLAGQHGIEIDTSDVTLDLNGFAIRGDLELGSLDGIHVTLDTTGSDRKNITIRNGVVRDFGEDGIDAFDSRNGLIIDVRAHHNGLGSSGGHGIKAGWGYTVRSCVASENRSAGQSNQGNGISSIHGTSIVDCAALENEGDGINAGVGGTIVACSARDNGDDGITSGNGTVVADCSSRQNSGKGIYVPQRGVIRGCAASGNAEHGIESINESVITDCMACDNTMDGILATDCLVRGNVARNNGGTNISALGGTTVLENHQ